MELSALREALSRFQSELFRDLAKTVRMLKQQPDSEPVSIGDLPPELRARYVGRTGQYRLFVYPAENVWEFSPLTRFVADVQSVDPDARGTTVTTFEYLRVLREGYTRAALYAFVGVTTLALIVFRGVVPALLALVPLTLGAIWTLGLMGWMGVAFNAANLLLLPLIVGIGIDNGVYLVHRFREATDGPDGPRPLAPSAAKAITLASLTNAVGFGSLMLSGHRGIFSLGFVVAVGVVCLWVASLTTLPSLLALFGQSRPADRVSGGGLSLGGIPIPGRPHTPCRFSRGNQGRKIMRHDQHGRTATRSAVGSTVIAALTLLGCAALPAPVWATGPQDRVRSLVVAVSAVLEDSALRGAARKPERRAQIATIIRDAFDFESMARDALGRPGPP